MTKPGAFSVTTRQLILARAGGYCERRGCTAPASNIHHRRARGMGGDRRPETASASNGVALCGSGTQGCHGWVEAHPNEARELGLRVHRNHDPAEIPVYLRHGWVLLTAEGKAEPTADPTTSGDGVKAGQVFHPPFADGDERVTGQGQGDRVAAHSPAPSPDTHDTPTHQSPTKENP